MTGTEVLLASVATNAGKEALKRLVSSLYDGAGKELQEILKKAKANRGVLQLFQQIAAVRRVKTLWQLDKAVDLATFYCDSHVLIRNGRVRVACLADLGNVTHVVIEGGHGAFDCQPSWGPQPADASDDDDDDDG
jgi:hypothetical protein